MKSQIDDKDPLTTVRGIERAPNTQLTVIESTRLALNSAVLEKEFTELAKASAGLTEITNAASYEELHAAQMRLVKGRTNTEKNGKAERDKFNAIVKQISAEEKRLIAIIKPEEDRLAAIKDAHNDKIERERTAKAEAETARLVAIADGIAKFTNAAPPLVGKTSQEIAAAIEAIRAEDVTAWAQECAPQARAAQEAAIATLELLLAGTVAREIEMKASYERAAREREDLERLRKEAQDRAFQEAENTRLRIAEEAKRQAEIDARERASREKIEAEERTARLAREEADREAAAVREAKLAEIRREQEAETERLRILRAAEDQARLEKDAAERAQRAQEDAERAKQAEQQAERDRAQRAEQARLDEEKRVIERQKDELLATDGLIAAVRKRIGDLPQYAGIAKAIDLYIVDALGQTTKPAGKRPARQGTAS